MRWLLLLCVVASTGPLGGCAIDHGPGGGSKAASAQPARTPGGHPESCTIYDQSGDAEVTFHADIYVEPACQESIRNFGQGGDYWSETDTSTSRDFGYQPRRIIVCKMANDTTIVTVRDSGGTDVGRQICAQLAGDGYTDLS